MEGVIMSGQERDGGPEMEGVTMAGQEPDDRPDNRIAAARNSRQGEEISGQGEK
jgi:hypothetical protein